MVKEIMDATGIKHRETRFKQPPSGTYAVWGDFMQTRGADDALMIEEHSSTIELYTDSIDAAAEALIEAELTTLALPYEKSDHTWLDKEQKYMTVYQFDYTKKRR